MDRARAGEGGDPVSQFRGAKGWVLRAAFRQIVISAPHALPGGSALIVPTDRDAWIVSGLAIKQSKGRPKVLTFSELAALRPSHRPVWMVPCATVLANDPWSRPRLLVMVGAPERHPELDPEEAVECVEQSLEALEFAPALWDELIALAELRRLYAPRGLTAAERVEQLRPFEEGWTRFRGEPDVRELVRLIGGHLDRRLAMGLGASDLGALERPAAFGKLARLAGVGVTLALALGGAILNTPFSFAAGLALSPEGGAGRRFLAAFLAPLGHLSLLAAGAALGRGNGALLALGAIVFGTACSAALHRRAISIPRFARAVREDLTPARAAKELWVDRLSLAENAEAVVERVRESYIVRFPAGSIELPMHRLH